MESSLVKPTPSEAHPDTMDFLSSAWCNFAVQALHPSSIVLLDKFDCTNQNKAPFPNKMNDADCKSLPPWKSNDLKSWIWMQQAMHPEVNYNRKKWLPWKAISIKKWLKERNQKRKEEDRLQRAQVHAALSVAGVAAALAAIAAENSSSTDKEAAMASAAALVAAQCAQVAEAMGARKEQVCSVVGSAMSGTSASDILTLTAAATTSIRGAATLKARTGYKSRLNGSVPVLPIQDNSEDHEWDFHRCRSILERGAEMHVETPDGNFGVRSVSVMLNSEAKVILRLRKLNMLRSKKESVVLELHAELYNDSETDTCYLIVVRTKLGVIKLDMGDDYHRYKTWATTITRMLMLSPNSLLHQ